MRDIREQRICRRVTVGQTLLQVIERRGKLPEGHQHHPQAHMGFQQECRILGGMGQRQELLGKFTRQVQTALRAVHMVEPAEDRKTLRDLRVRLTQRIRSSIQAFHLGGSHPLGDHAEGAERDGELQLQVTAVPHAPARSPGARGPVGDAPGLPGRLPAGRPVRRRGASTQWPVDTGQPR